MRKLTGILFLFFTFISLSQAQVNFIAENASADKGDTIRVKIRAARFNAIASFDYRQSYDTTAFRFIDVVDKHIDINAITYLGPQGMAQPGEFIAFSWLEPTVSAITIPDTANLYTIRFIAQGNEGDKDSIKFTSRTGINGIQISDVDNMDIPFTLDNGLMTINGGSTGGGPLKVFLTEQTGDKGQQKCLDLSVEDFTDILDFQLAFKWDKAVATYSNVKDINLKGLSTGSFAIHPVTKELRMSWSEPAGNAITLNGKTKIASICYDLTGNTGSSTAVQIANDGSFFLEASNGNGDDVNIETNHGKLTINQGSSGGGNFTLIASKETADKNSNVCVDISVKGFTNVAGMQFTMAWDKSILLNPNIKNTNLKYLDAIGSFNIKDGSLICSWDDTAVEGIDVSDNTVIFQLCFTTSGNCDANSSVIFKDNDKEKIDIFDPDLNDIAPVDLVQGEVKIECNGGGGDEFDLTIKSGTIEEDKEICVDMDVKNFTDIESMQFSLVWNPSIIMFTRINNISLPGFNASSYSENPTGSLRVAFSPINPITFADGTMFEVCFQGLDCDKSSNLTFSNVPIDIEAANSVKDLNVVIHNGSINVTCKSIDELKVEVAGKKDVKCRDDENGSIGINVSGANGYTYQWYKDGAAIPAPKGQRPSLSFIGAGEYYVVVTDANDASRTVTLSPVCTLLNPPLLVLTKIADTRDDGSCNGSIEIMVEGGWGMYSYEWVSTSQPRQRTVKLMDVCKGNMHIVNVLDKNNCRLQDTFTVFGPVIEANAVASKLNCNGDCDATITVAPTGGCEPFTYNWSGTGTDKTAKDQSELCAGNYKVTITGSLGDTEIVTFTILDPSGMVITFVSKVNGINGEINVEVTGGVKDYKYDWKNSNGITVSQMKNLRGVGPGIYTLTVTDKNGCTKTFTNTILPGGFEVIENTIDVTCNGENDGEIDLEVENANDYIIIWDHDPNLTDFIATGLSAGDYLVTIKDQNGKDIWSKTFTIIEPEVLTLNVVKIKCATGDNVKNGSYEVQVTGGTPIYTYDWCSGETTAKAVRLSGGTDCDVLVVDANGCQAFFEEIEICSDSSSVPPPSDCYEGRKVITPNEDGLNDYLLITCDSDFPNKLSVFDRWGRLVFEQLDYNSTNGLGWSGVDSNGTDLNEGGYMWVLRVDLPNGDQRLYRGTVVLAR